ncbi:glycerophosphoryl diester phosphodiesterase [Pseudorhizobium tarimense]|uniref:Glycerophosphoryl diester phosphodiesterase n=1 Tax=Pseudorhizobium tarimense TaxID=1079109 RepID=A0ABV2H8W8_9HYPH|nr:glycerophosphodiester phosphodiesterase family protein [Pseudorhizobium tarimense]MCJ8520040.1 glycerophosphodiester phosphodiesterase [Pseudorhizobium tarimense]
MNDFSGLAITHQGHTIRLKWHRLRRRLDDPLFSSRIMAEGFRLGASMELDLRVRADGGFAVLHDDLLEGETTGSGPVHQATAAELSDLRMKIGGEKVSLSEDLAGMLPMAHPEALLQFDIKDTLDQIGGRGLDHIATHFDGLGKHVIVSADDQDLILAIKKRVPDLRRGIDPTGKLVDLFRESGLTAVERALVADIKGPSEPETIYLAWPLLLDAAKQGLDLVALCHQHKKKVDAWTYNLRDAEAGFSDAEWDAVSQLLALKPDQLTTDQAPGTERAWHARLAMAA